MNGVSRPNDYEKSDADPRLIGALALGIAAFLAIAPLLLHAGYEAVIHAGRIGGALPQPPQPRLQIRPKVDLERLRAFEQDRLETFGWADRGRRIVHIPIERAMQLLTERGRSEWPAPVASSPR